MTRVRSLVRWTWLELNADTCTYAERSSNTYMPPWRRLGSDIIFDGKIYGCHARRGGVRVDVQMRRNVAGSINNNTSGTYSWPPGLNAEMCTQTYPLRSPWLPRCLVRSDIFKRSYSAGESLKVVILIQVPSTYVSGNQLEYSCGSIFFYNSLHIVVILKSRNRWFR
jgi:hypothetical protein